MTTRPLYTANPDHTLSYGGNRLFGPIKRISDSIPHGIFEKRPRELRNSTMWAHAGRINQGINAAVHDYFRDLGSIFVLPPMTTRLLSSPKAIYAKKGTTSEAPPIRLKWFGKEMFLQQSSQLYMELAVTPKDVDSAYCVFNSFRGESADATHLSEFHMIEYEGKISQKKNKAIIVNLLRSIIKRLLSENSADLSFFIFDEDMDYLKRVSKGIFGTEITFEQALDTLYRKTHDKRYREFTMRNFGSWEEVLLSTELGDMAIVSEFPYAEVAFYQAALNRGGREVSETADFIWPSYREIAGGAHRARSSKELLAAIKRFNLPLSDYRYYLESRMSHDYKETSGFGLGWERLVQGLLRMPYVYSATAFPRVNSTIYP